MTFLLLALLVGFALATGIVLADSGLRLHSAFGNLAAQERVMKMQQPRPASRRGHAAVRPAPRAAAPLMPGALAVA